MTPRTAIEWAFELARTGEFLKVEEIRKRLHSEGYDSLQIEGGTLTKQIRGIIADARRAEKGASPLESLNPSNDK